MRVRKQEMITEECSSCGEPYEPDATLNDTGEWCGYFYEAKMLLKVGAVTKMPEFKSGYREFQGEGWSIPKYLRESSRR